MNIKRKNSKSKEQDIYDFSGPLWEKYHADTRKKVRFPRGYKEVNIVTQGI